MNIEFTPETILRAYCMGVFPMGDEGGFIRWYSPDPRCIIDLDSFHIPRRLLRTYKAGGFTFAVNQNWHEVISACAQRETTWITPEIIRGYTELYHAGFAHSVEVYKMGRLAGGLYGVSIRGAFMGESMFHTETDASKVALVYLVERLKARGFILLDTQYATPHLARFGARLIPRQEYLMRLGEALKVDCRFYP